MARLVVGTDDPEGRHVAAHRKRWAWQQNQAWTQVEPDVGSLGEGRSSGCRSSRGTSAASVPPVNGLIGAARGQ
jgi:hypothetical protein